MKAYTDLNQSKKLAEILPMESADMRYDEYISYIDGTPKVGYKKGVTDGIPCWSLAALLEVLPSIEGFKPIIDLDINQIRYEGRYRNKLFFYNENLIDSCYEMILKLHKCKML